MYVVTLFRIESEVRFQDAVSQDIDYRVVKTFDHREAALQYVQEIRNRMLMFNFPFAMVQAFSRLEQLEITEQVLFSYDALVAQYCQQPDMAFLSLSTRRRLHDFDEDVVLSIQHNH